MSAIRSRIDGTLNGPCSHFGEDVSLSRVSWRGGTPELQQARIVSHTDSSIRFCSVSAAIRGLCNVLILESGGSRSLVTDQVGSRSGSLVSDQAHRCHPAFTGVAPVDHEVGKLIGLNGEISLSQLTRRLIEVWGDRSTLRPATQRIVRSTAQWSVLRDAKKPGRYPPLQKNVSTCRRG